MTHSMFQAFQSNFLGNAPKWYKQAIIIFLIINPILFIYGNAFITGWLLLIEFIFTLAMALKCYPLQPGGLLAIQAVILGMTTPNNVLHEIEGNLPVILLLIFMVAGIYFMKDLLLFVFNKILTRVRNKILLSLIFCILSAFLSAFLDALTVTAVLISVAVGFYAVYHKIASDIHGHHDTSDDNKLGTDHHATLRQFRAFLRSLLMHGAVGTALGGVCTMVGEPQNLIIAEMAGWNFIEFFLVMAPITMPVLGCGLVTCILLEKTKKFGYGESLPEPVYQILKEHEINESSKRTQKDIAKLWVQALTGLLLVLSLAMHLAEVGVIGLAVIVILTSFNGIIEEHQIGKAFEEALPFTSLLVVFFTIVAVIHDQHLFQPVIDAVLTMPLDEQPAMFFLANGILSAISDNVFVATVYIGEVKQAYDNDIISKEHFDKLAIAINTGTNLPSVATPNGQAAFLFLLTSAIAPLIRLSYGRMVFMALPYTIVLTIVGLIMVSQL